MLLKHQEIQFVICRWIEHRLCSNQCVRNFNLNAQRKCNSNPWIYCYVRKMYDHTQLPLLNIYYFGNQRSLNRLNILSLSFFSHTKNRTRNFMDGTNLFLGILFSSQASANFFRSSRFSSFFSLLFSLRNSFSNWTKRPFLSNQFSKSTYNQEKNHTLTDYKK